MLIKGWHAGSATGPAPGETAHVRGVDGVAVQVHAAGDARTGAPAGQNVHQRRLSGACAASRHNTRESVVVSTLNSKPAPGTHMPATRLHHSVLE